MFTRTSNISFISKSTMPPYLSTIELIDLIPIPSPCFLLDKNLITIEDLYRFSEQEVIEKIENCEEQNLANCFKLWKNATQIKESDVLPEEIYAVHIEKVKIRYINPLVRISENQYKRASEVSNKAKQNIEKALHFKTKKYAYLDFDF